MKPFVVAVTGGIASGKTVFAEYLCQGGAELIDADVVAREVVEPGSAALAAISAHFGADILLPDGRLNRAALRARVFAEPAERQWLEGLLHPLIRARMLKLGGASTAPYVVAVIPLLAEGGGLSNYPWVDRVAVVDVAESIQVQRLKDRDNTDEALARKMIEAQATRAQRLAIADDVIGNNGTLAELAHAARRMDALYKALADVDV